MLIKQTKIELGKSNMETVFKNLKQIVSDYGSFQNEFLVIESKWSNLKKGKLKGVVSNDQINLEDSRIKDSLLNLVDLIIKENPEIIIELSPGLLKMLEIIYKNCKINDVPFETPYLLNIAMTYPQPKIKESFNETLEGAFDLIKQRIDNFILKHKEKSKKFYPVNWYDLESIKTAQKLAVTSQSQHITSKYLLLGILNTSSGTQNMIIEILGHQDLLEKLIDNVSKIIDTVDENPDKLKTDI